MGGLSAGPLVGKGKGGAVGLSLGAGGIGGGGGINEGGPAGMDGGGGTDGIGLTVEAVGTAGAGGTGGRGVFLEWIFNSMGAGLLFARGGGGGTGGRTIEQKLCNMYQASRNRNQ